ncbi:MAG: FtsH protease activity modulator HflK [Maricaulaceae bacterium]|nr:FtsH protease activity modulator HflK [Maricaulaceae bacterium]
MPWNDKSGGNGGPWGSGPGGGRDPNNPWGRPGGQGGGGGGGQEPPDLDELIASMQRGLRRAFGGGGRGSGGGKGGGKGFGASGLGMILVLAALLWVGWPNSGWYQVRPEQAGVILRFGEYQRTTGPGFHLKLPWPVETVLLPEVTTVHSIIVGVNPRTGQTVAQEALMLTRDENIVDINFTVQWRVDYGNPERPDGVRDFLFNVRRPEAAIKAVAESAMREVVGSTELEPLITRERQNVARRVRAIMQETLNSYNTGVQILEVQLQKADPPGEVIEAFRDVIAAAQDAERLALDATAYSNRIIPEARGDAARELQNAQGYRDRVVAEAEGQAARFNSIYDEYRLAPDVTRRRMFLETMELVIGRSDLLILDSGGGAVPYLPLDRLGQDRVQRTQREAGQ